jgi:hypothetical protein
VRRPLASHVDWSDDYDGPVSLYFVGLRQNEGKLGVWKIGPTNNNVGLIVASEPVQTPRPGAALTHFAPLYDTFGMSGPASSQRLVPHFPSDGAQETPLTCDTAIRTPGDACPLARFNR